MDANCDQTRGRGYLHIHDHALIGNLRTAALISIDGSVESYCLPHFDSPSVFARILDKDKGGHFSISPHSDVKYTIKQSYLPNSNILTTKFLSEVGVVLITDFLPRQSEHTANSTKPLLPWLVRRVECIRGEIPVRMECAPAFNYARDKHTIKTVQDDSSTVRGYAKVVFTSKTTSLDLRYVAEAVDDKPVPRIQLEPLDLTAQGHLGLSVAADFVLHDGEAVTFVLRQAPEAAHQQQQQPHQGIVDPAKSRPRDDPYLTAHLVRNLLGDTNRYWQEWIGKSTYKGAWRETVLRSALALKLLIFEPTGAIIASPTFSLPEGIGTSRCWDYRYTWIRDSSFTLYALIRLGFTSEAVAYLEFISSRLQDRSRDGSLSIMYTIHGTTDLEEIELTHLDGHKGSRPVRIGNGAATHVQLDIYGELMDCIYLGQKYARPMSYDLWLDVRKIVDYVVAHMHDPDLSIWEVRSRMRNFTYSKVMMWVAIDRGLRIADKRSLPCPQRNKWLNARDELYDTIMEKAWNPEQRFFAQSYEDPNVVDSAVLIMALTFFMPAADPRFKSTLQRILKSPDKHGLTVNGLVYRYDTTLTDDGVGGEEGTFCLCTLWAIEAMTRAGAYDPSLLQEAVRMFEDFTGYLNHVGLCAEEIGAGGEQLGNAVQGFSHVTLISCAYNLSRTLEARKHAI